MDKPGGSFWRWGRGDTHRFLPGFRRAGRGGSGLGDHVRRPCRREWGWGGNPDVERPSFRTARFSSGSGQSRPRYRQYRIWVGGCPRRYHQPPVLGPRSTGRTVLWLGPPGRHPTVTGSLSTPSVLSLILQGHPRPRCPAELAALRPLGIDRRAGDAPPRLRSHRPLPRPGYAGRGLGAASWRLRAAAGPGSRPATKAETDRLLPIAPASPLQGWLGRRGGGERAQLPRPRRSAPHPRSSSVANYPLLRALNPQRAARPGRGRALGWGEGGVAVTLRLTTTSGCAWRF